MNLNFRQHLRHSTDNYRGPLSGNLWELSVHFHKLLCEGHSSHWTAFITVAALVLESAATGDLAALGEGWGGLLVDQANWVRQRGTRTFGVRPKRENEPAKTAFEVKGTSRLDFSEVSVLSPQSGPQHLRTGSQGRAEFQDTNCKALLSLETVSLASSYFCRQLLFESFELQQETN